MHVEVIRQARPGDPAQVHADIEAVGLIALLKHVEALLRDVHQLVGGRRFEIRQVARVRVGCDHQVPAVVGIPVEYHEYALGAKEQQIAAVVVLARDRAQEALTRALV